MKFTAILLVLGIFMACTSEARTEYVLDEKDLVPEGIAYSVKKNAFYLTSVTKSKIVAVDRATANNMILSENRNSVTNRALVFGSIMSGIC